MHNEMTKQERANVHRALADKYMNRSDRLISIAEKVSEFYAITGAAIWLDLGVAALAISLDARDKVIRHERAYIGLTVRRNGL